MKTRDRILQWLGREDGLSGGDLCRRLGLTRQAVHKHLRQMIAEGVIEKRGSTKAAEYQRAGHRPSTTRTFFRKAYMLRGLEEDRVLEEVALYLRLKHLLSSPAWALWSYAFTEMLNNAIEHSGSRQGLVEAVVDDYEARFVVRDQGIGAFHSIASHFHLRDENMAAAELLKGKATTMASRHSGEGIFFTSKAADLFTLRSHHVELLVDRRKNDTFLSSRRFLRGTEVRFVISRRSRRRLQDLFDAFAPADYDYKFQRTRLRVHLAQPDYVSRSEARRLVNRLDRFREVVLDFKGVRTIGQSFADEVFRVFARRHPGLELQVENAVGPVAAMIRHVVDK